MTRAEWVARISFSNVFYIAIPKEIAELIDAERGKKVKVIVEVIDE